MSNKHATQVWSIKGVSSSERLVLVCLADFADKDGYCWPSITALAERCVMTDRGIQKIINRLCEYGYLERELRSGKATIYRLTPEPHSEVTPEPCSPLTPERGSDVPPNVETPTPEPRFTPTPERGDIPIKKNPHLNPHRSVVGAHAGDKTRLPIDILPEWKNWAGTEKGWSGKIIDVVWREFQSYWNRQIGHNAVRSMQDWEIAWQAHCLKQNIKGQQAQGSNNRGSNRPSF